MDTQTCNVENVDNNTQHEQQRTGTLILEVLQFANDLDVLALPAERKRETHEDGGGAVGTATKSIHSVYTAPSSGYHDAKIMNDLIYWTDPPCRKIRTRFE